MITYLHAGHSPSDPGCTFDLDGDGIVSASETERAHVVRIRDETLAACRGVVPVEVTPDGLTAGGVQDWMLGQGEGRLILLHIDAGLPATSAPRGGIYYAGSSTRGATTAGALATALRERAPAIAWPLYRLPAEGYPRPWACIRRVTESPLPVHAVLLECGYLGHRDCAYLYTSGGHRLLGEAIAVALSRLRGS